MDVPRFAMSVCLSFIHCINLLVTHNAFDFFVFQQYHSATSIYFMSTLVQKYNIVFDRGVCCVGHGKPIIDAINGTDKNTIIKFSGCEVKEAANAVKQDSTKLKIHTMQNSKAVSPSDDCINILKREYDKV